MVWFGMVTMLAGGGKSLRTIAKTSSLIASVFAPNLLPGGKRTSFYSIQMLARKHPEWYRDDLAVLLDMHADGRMDPTIAAVWKLDEVPVAADGLAHGAMPGKQVIAIPSQSG